nr:MAG TPA: hypothetical protein [Caudoviricetes sp.]
MNKQKSIACYLSLMDFSLLGLNNVSGWYTYHPSTT